MGRALWRSFSCTTAHCLQGFSVQSIFELENKAEPFLICSILAGVWIKGRADGSFLGFVHALQQERRKFRFQGRREIDEEGERKEWLNGKMEEEEENLRS